LRNAVLLPLAFMALLAPGALSVPAAPDRAEYSYAGGSLLSGDIAGNCEAHAILFPDRAPGKLLFRSFGGMLHHYVTEWNYTAIRPYRENRLETVLDARQWHTEHVVPAGRGEITWDARGASRIFGEHWPMLDLDVPVVPFTLDFDATTLRSGPVTNQFITGMYYLEYWNTIYTYEGGVDQWARYVHLGGGETRGHGNVTVYLEAARTDVGAFSYALPDRRENVTKIENEAFGYYTVRFHNAYLRLQNATFSLGTSPPKAICGDLRVHADGSLLAYQAAGRVSRQVGAQTFQRRELSLAGAFDLADSPHEPGANSPARAEAKAEGRFTAVGLDFAPLPPEGSYPALLKIGLWTALLAALATGATWFHKSAWWLFTRLERDRLLDLRARNVILDAIRASGSVTMPQLQEATGLGRSTLRYHLYVLDRHRLVRAEQRRGLKAFTLREGRPSVQSAAWPAIRSRVSDGPMRLADLIRDLSRDKRYSRFGAWKVVRRAAEDGEIVLDRKGRGVWVRCP
jgi:DNA-binding transcriptional ArsR family regulator